MGKIKGFLGKNILKGKTKIFWNDTARVILNEQRQKGFLDSIIVIQSLCHCVYIRKNYTKLKIVRDGLKNAYLSEDITQMMHWKSITEKMQFEAILDYYARVDIVLKIYNANSKKNNDELLQLLKTAEDMVPESNFVQRLKYEIPIKDAMKKVENDENVLEVLKNHISNAEKYYPELDVLQDARVEFIFYVFLCAE